MHAHESKTTSHFGQPADMCSKQGKCLPPTPIVNMCPLCVLRRSRCMRSLTWNPTQVQRFGDRSSHSTVPERVLQTWYDEAWWRGIWYKGRQPFIPLPFYVCLPAPMGNHMSLPQNRAGSARKGACIMLLCAASRYTQQTSLAKKSCKYLVMDIWYNSKLSPPPSQRA